MEKLSSVIITYNEEDKIERCLKSLLRVSDEIVVLDSFSTDRTEDICKRFGVKFHKQKFLGYRDQKNLALSLASYDFVLSLDADEALSVELERSILEAKKNRKFDAYRFNRLDNYCGQWIYHSKWYPDCKIRLFDKTKGQWEGLNIHETVRMKPEATVGFLKGDLLHWSLKTYDEHINKVHKFSTISAQEYYKAGKKCGGGKIFFNSFWRFVNAYVFHGGFRDGFNGFVICALSAYTTFLKYLKLRQLYLEQSDAPKRKKSGNGKVNVAS